MCYSRHRQTVLARIWVVSFFFSDTAPTQIYTLSLHDALPISAAGGEREGVGAGPQRDAAGDGARDGHRRRLADRKSTRLNSSHANISYAVFCLKKKKKNITKSPPPEEHTPTQNLHTPRQHNTS